MSIDPMLPPTTDVKANGHDKIAKWPDPDPGWPSYDGRRPDNSKTELSAPPAPVAQGISIMPTKRPIMSHTVRVLSPDEIQQLAHLFETNGTSLPDPATSCIIGAIDSNGKVTNNFIVGQLRLHTEPLHLEPGNEHLFRPLARALYDHVSKQVGTVDVFLFAPNDYIIKMAEAMGMEREPWTVMSSRIYANPVGPVLIDQTVNDDKPSDKPGTEE